MVALHTSLDTVDPVAICSADTTIERRIAKMLGVRTVYLVKWDAETNQFIANALSPARPHRVYFQYEADFGEEIAKVVVDEDQLDAAFGPEGLRTRLAAMLTEQSIEVIFPTKLRLLRVINGGCSSFPRLFVAL
jgi:transcription antitermination factor NusA-like protein